MQSSSIQPQQSWTISKPFWPISHSPGPGLYLSVILGVTTFSLYHLLGKSTSNFLGMSAYLPFLAAVSLQAPPSLSTSERVTPLAAANLSPGKCWQRGSAQSTEQDMMAGTITSSSQHPCQVKCAFCSSSPRSHRRDPKTSRKIPSLAPQLLPPTPPHCKYRK